MLLFNVGESFAVLVWLKYFNTSNVTIQLAFLLYNKIKKTYFNTSNVTIQPLLNLQ